ADVKPEGVAASCLATAIGSAQFEATQRGGKFQRTFDGDPKAVVDHTIAPGALEALRVKGNRNIVPDIFVKRLLQNSAETRVVTAVRLCVDATGKVSRVIRLKSSGYPAYDEKIATEIKAWEFKPLVVDGKAVSACTAAKFIYSLK